MVNDEGSMCYRRTEEQIADNTLFISPPVRTLARATGFYIELKPEKAQKSCQLRDASGPPAGWENMSWRTWLTSSADVGPVLAASR